MNDLRRRREQVLDLLQDPQQEADRRSATPLAEIAVEMGDWP
jgi:hypothetical protein